MRNGRKERRLYLGTELLAGLTDTNNTVQHILLTSHFTVKVTLSVKSLQSKFRSQGSDSSLLGIGYHII